MKQSTCKYIKKPDGSEFFSTRMFWMKAEQGGPIDGHLVICTTLHGGWLVVRAPRANSAYVAACKKGHRRVNAQLWRELVLKRGIVWWCYLKPCAWPPEQPKKKFYTEAELSTGHRRLKIITEDQ